MERMKYLLVALSLALGRLWGNTLLDFFIHVFSNISLTEKSVSLLLMMLLLKVVVTTLSLLRNT